MVKLRRKCWRVAVSARRCRVTRRPPFDPEHVVEVSAAWVYEAPPLAVAELRREPWSVEAIKEGAAVRIGVLGPAPDTSSRSGTCGAGSMQRLGRPPSGSSRSSSEPSATRHPNRPDRARPASARDCLLAPRPVGRLSASPTIGHNLIALDVPVRPDQRRCAQGSAGV